uniref:cytochrome P450 n=1 Tax=Mycobacterium sp. TaxID=1785 RepID=UPI003F9AE6CB
MGTRIMDDAARLLADPQAYTDEKRLHEALAHLRAHAPVSWVDVQGYRPFWAITKHADVMDIERQNDLFTNDPRPLLMVSDGEDVLRAQMEAGIGLRTLIHMDDPHHRDMRKIGADWFRPKVLRDLKVRVDELAKIYVDKMVEKGPECDFVQEVAVNYPLYVILSLLGLPESDFPRMLKLTQEMFGGDDTEFQRGKSTEDMLAVLLDFFNYFAALTASRREHPTEDLASAIANATINGEPLSDMDTASYYVIVASAGHDTTSAGIAGGMLALLENPGELARLQKDMGLMGTAVEEMIRCVVPVTEFMRTAQADTEVRGVPIAKGESVLLSYVSANRDEEVFKDPMRFDVGRDPNRHLSFGYGVHFCLGAALARMEMNSFFSELVPRIKSIELAGEPE